MRHAVRTWSERGENGDPGHDASCRRSRVVTLNRRAAERLGIKAQRLGAQAQRLVLEARRIVGAVRELLRIDADLDALAESASGQLRQLVQVTVTYRSALRRSGLADQVEALGLASPLVTPGLLTVFGYVRLSLAELRFLDAAAEEGSELYLLWEDQPYFEDTLHAAQMLQERGWTVERRSEPSDGLVGAFLGRTGGSGRVLAVGCEDDEVRAALRAVKGLLRAGTPASDIALVVQDDGAWAPRLRPVAQEYGVPVRYATSEPLADTRVGRWTEWVLATGDEAW